MHPCDPSDQVLLCCTLCRELHLTHAVSLLGCKRANMSSVVTEWMLTAFWF